MTELTGADIETIGRIIAKHGSRIMYEGDEEIYLAGLRAGVKRAHAAVDATEKTRGDLGGYSATDAYEEGRDDALMAIRALLNPRA